MTSYRPATYALRLIGLILLCCSYAPSSKKIQFQKDRQTLLEKVNMINKILEQTESKKKVNVGQLGALRKKIATNHALIHSLSKEVGHVNQLLYKQQQQINELQTELLQLKKEYARILFLGSKSMHGITTLVFIFSADSFQKFLQRIRATRQYVKIRKSHFESIQKLSATLETQRMALERKVKRKHTLLADRRKEQEKLNILQTKKKQIVQALEQEKSRLFKELKKQNAAVKNLDKLISDLVKQEMKAHKVVATEVVLPLLSADAKELANQFTQQRGKLPWPVKTGFISNKFGIRNHPVFKNVQIENLGIDIQTQEGSVVQAIFKGIVKTISTVPGMNRIVIVQHGNYHTVYAKLSTVTVKVGQAVQIGDPLGTIYTDPNGVSTLQFQIWQDANKLNPAIWLSKEP